MNQIDDRKLDNRLEKKQCLAFSCCFFIILQIQELVHESQAYKDLREFEKRLDSVIASKCLDMKEILKGPMKVKIRPTL